MIIRRLDTVDFSRAEWAELKHQPWLQPCDIAARGALLINGDRLYVRMEAKEKEIRAVLTDPLASVCCDSCLEFFLAPDVNDKRYFNLEWNPLGTIYLGFGAERETRIRQILPDPVSLFRAEPYRTADGWGITYSIPESFIRLYFPHFTLGQDMMGNMYKCGDDTAIPHYLAWNPLTSDHPDFHRRQDFGLLQVQ